MNSGYYPPCATSELQVNLLGEMECSVMALLNIELSMCISHGLNCTTLTLCLLLSAAVRSRIYIYRYSQLGCMLSASYVSFSHRSQ